MILQNNSSYVPNFFATKYYVPEYMATKLHAFNALLFGHPCNSQMASTILLYEEIFIIGLVIVYLLIEVLSLIIDTFKYTENPYPFHFSPEMESFLDIFFLLFPSSVILYILAPTLGFLYINESVSPNYSFSVDVIGHQWYWTYTYHLDNPIDLDPYKDIELYNPITIESYTFDCILNEDGLARLLTTDNKLILPVHTYIRVDITSEDVIHSWSIPQLGIKVDAIPGRVTSIILYSSVETILYGQCSELCGALHAFMPIEVSFVSSKNFFIWINNGEIDIVSLPSCNFINCYLDIFVIDFQESENWPDLDLIDFREDIVTNGTVFIFRLLEEDSYEDFFEEMIWADMYSMSLIY